MLVIILFEHLYSSPMENFRMFKLVLLWNILAFLDDILLSFTAFSKKNCLSFTESYKKAGVLHLWTNIFAVEKYLCPVYSVIASLIQMQHHFCTALVSQSCPELHIAIMSDFVSVSFKINAAVHGETAKALFPSSQLSVNYLKASRW